MAIQLVADITADLSRRASTQPDAEALVLPGRRLSFAQLDDLVWRAAACFHERGVRSGHVVATWLGDDLLMAVATLGLARLGATVARVATSSTPTQLQAQLRQVGVDFVVGQDQPPASAATTILFGEEDLVQFGGRRPPAATASGPVFLVFGSGSTGDPKVMAFDAPTILARSQMGAKDPLCQAGVRLLLLSGLQFALPMMRMLALFHVGGTPILMNHQNLNLVRYCDETQATVIEGAVMHFEQILGAIGQTPQRLFNSLRAARVSGSTVSRELRERIRRYIAPVVSVRYGTNECGVISELWDDGTVDAAPTSLGQAADGVELEIISVQGSRLKPGGIGRILVRTPGMISGYLGDPQATQARFRDGWFDTGDLGHLTAGGELIFHGRADAMMIFNGINIYPAEIENCLRLLEDMQDVHVFALNHKVHQHVPACAVALKPGSRLTEEDIQRFTQQHLGFKSPQLLLALEAIPRTPGGKLDRTAFMQLVQAELQRRSKAHASTPQRPTHEG